MLPLTPALSLVLAASVAAAPIGQTHRPSAALASCLAAVEAHGGSDSDELACAHAEWLRRDGELNRAYGRVMGRLPPRRRAALRDDERGWVASRESVCGAQRQSNAGGKGARTYEDCLTDQTLGRLDYLGWVERHRRL